METFQINAPLESYCSSLLSFSQGYCLFLSQLILSPEQEDNFSLQLYSSLRSIGSLLEGNNTFLQAKNESALMTTRIDFPFKQNKMFLST